MSANTALHIDGLLAEAQKLRAEAAKFNHVGNHTAANRLLVAAENLEASADKLAANYATATRGR